MNTILGITEAYCSWSNYAKLHPMSKIVMSIVMSYVFMGMGFLIMFSGSFVSGMWLLLIGWFLNSDAQSYL
jgi:hypothetical protein